MFTKQRAKVTSKRSRLEISLTKAEKQQLIDLAEKEKITITSLIRSWLKDQGGNHEQD